MARAFPRSLRDPVAPAADRVKIVTKYVLKEHFGPLVFALSALTSLLLLNYVAKQLGQLLGKGLPPGVIAEFLVLSLPLTVAMTMPMAVLVATLHAFSRLAAENEITAFKASGMALQRLMVPVIAAAGVLMLVMIWFNDQVLPSANHKLTTLTNDIARKKPTFALREQVINEVSPGRLFLRTAHLTPASNKMRDVTIYDLGDPQHRRTIRADSGLLELSPDRQDLNLTLFDGSMLETTMQEPARLQRLFFHTDFFRVRGIGNQLERSTQGGIKSDREMTVCELQRRVIQAARQRDSSLRQLQRLNPAAAQRVRADRIRGGIGDIYCRLVTALSKFTAVRTASAAEVRQQPVKTVPPQASVPAIAPSTGIVTAEPASAAPDQAPDLSQRSVMVETLKLDLEIAQSTIDGNQVEIEKKFAIAAACVIFVLLGAPIALRFPRGGVGMTIGVSLGVFGLYYVGLIVGESLARRGFLSPFWAMWAANALLLIPGFWLTARLGLEGTTSRGSETSELFVRLRDRLRRRHAEAG